MFTPGHFTVDDRDDVLGLLRTAAFGHLVVADGDGFEASPLPFVVDDALTELRLHVARPNPIWRLAPRPALLVVTVSDAYISPSWYPGKAEHGKVVPTWNYEVVHVHGELEVRDTTWTAQLVRDLTDEHESGRATPWSVDDAPDEYIAKLGNAIVGLSLAVTRVEAKRKLSQNKSDEDRSGAIAGLAASDSDRERAVGLAMKRSTEEAE